VSNDIALNFLKGDFAELLAEKHFKQMGFQVDRTGKEFMAPNYANINIKSDNKDLIENHIQNLPDLLITSQTEWDVTSKKFKNTFEIGNSFVEVKFTSEASIKKYILKQIFKYRKYIFYPYTKNATLVKPAPDNWDLEDKKINNFIKKFSFNTIKKEHIKLPIMFYIFHAPKNSNEYDIYLVKYDFKVENYIFTNAKASSTKGNEVTAIQGAETFKSYEITDVSNETKEIIHRFETAFDKNSTCEVIPVKQINSNDNGFIKEFLDGLFSPFPQSTIKKNTEKKITEDKLFSYLSDFNENKHNSTYIKKIVSTNTDIFMNIFFENQTLLVSDESEKIWNEFYQRLNEDGKMNKEPSIDEFRNNSDNEEIQNIYLPAFVFTILTIKIVK